VQLERWGAGRAWVGPDPYEGLNSPLGRLARTRRTRQAVVQAYKRLPAPPPWPLRVEPAANAKALALALSAYATPAGRELPGATRFRSSLRRQLEEMNLRRDGAAWGYHFDAQTRHLFYAHDTPNAIATCFVVEALCDSFSASADPDDRELALRGRPFLLSLLAEAPGRGPFFAYVASGSELIHNASVLVCGTLARLNALEPDTEAERAAREAVATTVALQRSDGLWPYGEADNLGWADNFHTAYLLDGLARMHSGFGVAGEALERGLHAWREAFFDADGWARYVANSRFPLETHSSASAIDLLGRLTADNPGRADRDELVGMARRVADAAIRELWIPELSRFAFRRTARGLNKREFMRWTNAPMFRALARLCAAMEDFAP
jgi:polysaccharide biosynthesis protein VpsJ